MNRIYLSIMTLSVFISCTSNSDQNLISPDGKLKVEVSVSDEAVSYSVSKCDQMVLNPSNLGFSLKGMSDLGSGMRIVATSTDAVSHTWEQPWGEDRLVVNNYNELLVELEEKSKPNRRVNVRFRLFNDGVGFRYEFPKQTAMDEFVIMQENTTFNFAQDGDAWAIPSPAYYQRYYESLYMKRAISHVNDTVTTPVTIELDNGQFAAIHEAGLIDYAKMNLFSTGDNTLKTDLSPWASGEKVFAKAPFNTPWRTLTLTDSAAELISSKLMLNLNQPNKLEDIEEWFIPSKYVGIWWGMHMKNYTWNSGPKHGATTANTKKYIDFAADNGISGVLVEGWNHTWDGNWTENAEIFEFDRAYPDFDIKYLTEYGKKRGVSIVGHHETAGGISNYERQLDDAFAFAAKHNIKTVKTGYVGEFLQDGEICDGQYGVRHQLNVVRTAAKHKVSIVQHELVIPTGVLRTYPNMVAYECMRGQEWDAWSNDGGNPPSHTCILPFTRGLAGPMDFTPGTFNFTNKAVPGTRVQTTLAKQLALYIVIYSPVPMASDMIENYKNEPAFEFYREVACDWEKTVIPVAEIGEYIVTVRKDKGSEDWFLGAITNEDARELEISLDFLSEGKSYIAKIYEDGKDADWKSNPKSITIRSQNVDSDTKLSLKLATSGGCAIRFVQE